jgi:SAM-dependent methyltransferase
MNTPTPPAEPVVAEYGPHRGWNFARQAIEIAAPWLERAPSEWVALDVGCGDGFTATGLAKVCREVVGIEPGDRVDDAIARWKAEPLPNLHFYRAAGEDVADVERFDLILLDNVFEHVEKKREALAALSRALKPGGVMVLVVPNLAWPIEHHYGLPFLGWLPLRLANWYLRASKRGDDYTWASYGVTYFGLKLHLRRRPELDARFVTPSQLDWTTLGAKWHYRVGIALLKRFPFLWCISKSFLVVAKKTGAAQPVPLPATPLRAGAA